MEEGKGEKTRGPVGKAWDATKGYAKTQGKMFSAELGALGREGLNDARNIIMGPWGEGEKTPGTIGYPTSQEVTDSFGGTYEQRMEAAKRANEQGKDAKDKDAKKSKGREMGD